MDTEKYNEMQEKLAAGKPVTDEGPYYHHVQWESYKGWAKGKFGGAMIGTIIGTVVGVAAAAILLTFSAPLTIAGASVLAFAGMGLYKGMDEFGRIGTVTGAIAAGLDTAERRNAYNLKKTALEIKADMGSKEAAVELQELKEPAYRTTHYVPPQDKEVEHGPIFWKVALIGAGVGIMAGVLFATGGIANGIFDYVLSHVAEVTGAALPVLDKPAVIALSAATFGAFGASFGINRDIFRQIFDKTDMMYRGRVAPAPAKEVTRNHEKSLMQEQEAAKSLEYDSPIEYPASGTHFRDQQLARAQQALLEMDHTRMSPN